MISLFDRVENTVGKGENAGYQHFLLCPQCFPKPSFLGSLKVELCGKELIHQIEEFYTIQFNQSDVVLL